MMMRGLLRVGVLTGLLVTVCILADGQRYRPAISQEFVVDSQSTTIPKWSGGALVTVDGHYSGAPLITLLDPFNIKRKAISLIVAIPLANLIYVNGAARGVDGTIAHGGWARDDMGRVTGYLAIVSPDGQTTNLVRTEPYTPLSVAVAPDGTIWSRGAEFGGAARTVNHTDAGVLRHFDHAGKLLGTFIPQSTLKPDELLLGTDRLVCSVSRVGWYLSMGATSYYEVVDGNVVRFPAISLNPASQQITGLAITDHGNAFISRDVNGAHDEVFLLDRSRGVWNRIDLHIEGVADSTSLLLGSQADSLVIKTTWGDSRHYRMYSLDRLSVN
jgi:hypothetical protein